MDKKQVYQEKMEAQLKEWAAKIDELKAWADQAEAQQKLDYYEQVESLREKQDKARQKLEALRDAGEGAWEEIKAGVEMAWDDLSLAVDNAIMRFK